ATAEQLYGEYLAVVPDDLDVMVNYAGAIRGVEKSLKRQNAARQVYHEILRRAPTREDVRLKAAELAIEMGGAYYEEARNFLSILKASRKDDGNIEYLLGGCEEQAKEIDLAVKSFQAAIDHGAPQRIEASQRLAALLREQLSKPEQADQVIEAMVQSNPESY